MIRPWSDHETVSPQPASQPRFLVRLARSIFYWKIQRFAPNLTFKHSPRAAPATKYCTCHEKWHLNFTKYCTCHEMWHWNFTKYCACHEMWNLNFTKYCACHAKWLDCLYPPRVWNVIYNARSNRCHPPTSPNTAPATNNDTATATFHRKFPTTDSNVISNAGGLPITPTMIREWSDHDPTWNRQSATRLATEVTFQARQGHFLLKNITFRAQSYIPTFTTCCACHEKWHLNFTKYWDLNIANPLQKRVPDPSSTLRPQRTWKNPHDLDFDRVRLRTLRTSTT